MRPFLFAILASCGSSEWDGVYVGPLFASGYCSDGLPVAGRFPTQWALTEGPPGHLSIQSPCGCGGFAASVASGPGVFEAKDCPPVKLGPELALLRLDDGTLTHSGSVVRPDLSFTASRLSASCRARLRGQLERVR